MVKTASVLLLLMIVVSCGKKSGSSSTAVAEKQFEASDSYLSIPDFNIKIKTLNFKPHEKDKIKEAKNYILKSLMNIEKLQEKKLLEALYYELEGNFVIAIKLMKEAMELNND